MYMLQYVSNIPLTFASYTANTVMISKNSGELYLFIIFVFYFIGFRFMSFRCKVVSQFFVLLHITNYRNMYIKLRMCLGKYGSNKSNENILENSKKKNTRTHKKKNMSSSILFKCSEKKTKWYFHTVERAVELFLLTAPFPFCSFIHRIDHLWYLIEYYCIGCVSEFHYFPFSISHSQQHTALYHSSICFLLVHQYVCICMCLCSSFFCQTVAKASYLLPPK